MGSKEDFEVNVGELRSLMELRNQEALDKINSDFGGIDGLCRKLRTDQLNGLPNDKAVLENHRSVFGRNEIPPVPSKSFFRLCWDAMKDVTLIILMFAAIVSLALSFYQPNDPKKHVDKSEQQVGWIEGAAIFIAVIVVVLVTAFNDWSKEKQFRGLQSKIETEHKFSVIRGGEAIDLPVHELVVGDVARVKYGDLLPADGILIQSNDLKIDESSLTGESDLIKKSPDKDPILLSGTHAMEGSGRMLITAVGVNSQTGIIMTLLGATKENGKDSKDNSKNSKENSKENSQQTKEERSQAALSGITINGDAKKVTNGNAAASVVASEAAEENTKTKSVLQGKLSSLAIQIGYIGSIVAAATVIILIVRHCVSHYVVKHEEFNVSDLKHFIDYIIIGVTVLVIAVPEGLPLAITLALTYSVKKMKR